MKSPDYAAVDYLDRQLLDKLGNSEFRQRKPHPWANPEVLIRDDACRKLLEKLPETTQFETVLLYNRENCIPGMVSRQSNVLKGNFGMCSL